MLSASKEPDIEDAVQKFKNDDLDRFGMTAEEDDLTERERKSNLFKAQEDLAFAD